MVRALLACLLLIAATQAEERRDLDKAFRVLISEDGRCLYFYFQDTLDADLSTEQWDFAFRWGEETASGTIIWGDWNVVWVSSRGETITTTSRLDWNDPEMPVTHHGRGVVSQRLQKEE